MAPKRKREIAGVTGSSMIDLKAVLFAEQERSRNAGAGTIDNKKLKARSAGGIRNLIRQNRGIKDRQAMDEAFYEKERDPIGYSSERLREKSEIYDKLLRGDIPENLDEDEYLIDFEYKQLVGKSGDSAASMAAQFLKDLAGHDGPGRDAADLRRDAGGAVIISSAPKEMETDMDRRRREWEEDAVREDERERELEVEDMRRKHRHTLLDSLHEQTEKERASAVLKKEADRQNQEKRVNALRRRAAMRKKKMKKT